MPIEYIILTSLICLIVVGFIYYRLKSWCVEGTRYLKMYYPLKIATLENFLNQEEIDFLIKATEGHLQRSKVANKKGDYYYHEGRTSESCHLEKIIDRDHPIWKKIRETAGWITNYPSDNVEPPQILRYQEGQEFKNHLDTFGNTEGQNQLIASHGQRMVTIFVCLKSAEQGGETHFPIIKKKMKPKAGDAVIWENAKMVGKVCLINKTALHAGMKVVSGEKYGIPIWIHNKKQTSGV